MDLPLEAAGCRHAGDSATPFGLLGSVQRRGRRDDVSDFDVAVDVQRAAPVVPQPRKVGADDGIQFVFHTGEVAGARHGECLFQLLPPGISGQSQLRDGLKVLHEQPESRRPSLIVALLVVQAVRECEQPHKRRVRIDLDADADVAAGGRMRIQRPSEALSHLMARVSPPGKRAWLEVCADAP